MSYQNIALMGKKQSGKDTAANYLVSRYAYTRLAFADDLKRMALEVNPFVPTTYGVSVRLAALIADVGWDYAKEAYPEVRRLLQHMGQTVREIDPDFWIKPVLRKAEAGERWKLPVVVTDCRYLNEVETLKARGFAVVRITRPTPLGMPLRDLAAQHPSETELDGFPADFTLSNDGTVAQLHLKIKALANC